MSIRLLQTDSLRLHSFVGDRIPEYAILSHTWEDDELSFQELLAVQDDPKDPATNKSGYRKVVDTCRKAREDGIAYVWIDTCCIDKTSSAELSEAINSMYRWYQKARICYVLLVDFDTNAVDYEPAFSRCRWFTRGWCLQELLAPKNLDFFGKSWKYVGSKTVLKSFISKITGISEWVLMDGNQVSSTPVATRMSWAARRQTTRLEDVAYSLLGIFDVNMPMLYGEGPKAFLRLQEEIISRSNDRSILAWGYKSRDQALVEATQGTKANQAINVYGHLFANSPQPFADFLHWNDKTNAIRKDAFVLTNKGLYFRRVELLVEPQHGLFSLPLHYSYPQPGEVRMLLRKIGPGLFSKMGNALHEEVGGSVDGERSYLVVEEEIYINNTFILPFFGHYDHRDEYGIQVRSYSHDIFRAVQAIQRAPSSDRWDASRMLFFTSGERSVRAHWKVFPHLAQRTDRSDESKVVSHQQSFYLVAGLHWGDSADGLSPWVRLYSLQDWRKLEEMFGIITNLDDIAGHSDSASTSCRIETSSLIVTADIQLQKKKWSSVYELVLDLDFRAQDSPEKS